MFTELDSVNWIDHLDKMTTAYNTRPHNGVCGMSPNEAEKYKEDTIRCHLDKIENITLYDFKVGDTVRKKLSKKVFDKGYARKWTIKTYTIINENNGLGELNDGSIVRGDDMQKVPDINYEESDKMQQLQKEFKKVRKQK